MKIRRYTFITFLIGISLSYGQLTIGDASYINEDAQLILINNEDNTQNSRGVLMPHVNNQTELPLYNSAEPDLYEDDKTMAGLIMYQADIKRMVFYDGEKWSSTFFEDRNSQTRVSMDANMAENQYPQLGCFLVGCGENDIPFGLYNNRLDSDDLGIVRINGDINQKDFNNFKFKESGLYRVHISLSVKTSGIHVSPPTISLRALKNNEIISRNDIPLNEAILITAKANRTGTTEFIAMFDKNDQLKIQISAAVALLTVVDTYRVIPDERTYVIIEKLY